MYDDPMTASHGAFSLEEACIVPFQICVNKNTPPVLGIRPRVPLLVKLPHRAVSTHLICEDSFLSIWVASPKPHLLPFPRA